MVEYVPLKGGYAGSIPAGPTEKEMHFRNRSKADRISK